MITEKILFKEEMEEQLMSGIDKLANVVKTTLGPKGKNVLIKTGFQEIAATKDGVSVAREIRLKDPVENMGATLIKSVSVRVNDLVGDGTTSSIIFAQEMYKRGLAERAESGNVYHLQKSMAETVEAAINEIEALAKKDVTTEDIYNIALISANNDKEIAKTFKDIYERIGKNITILIEKGFNNTEVKLTKGMKIENGFLSPYSITDYNKLKTNMKNPLIFLYNGKIKNTKTLIPPMTAAAKEGRPLLIIADNIDMEPLKILVEHHAQGNLRSAVVKSPGYSQRKIELLDDISVLTGAKIYQANSDMKYFKVSDFGEVDTAEITMNDTLLVKDNVDRKKIADKIKKIKERIDSGVENDYEVRKLHERISNLDGGIVVVNVGAKTETEMLEKKDRYDDAKSAILAAIREGIVEGGGVAYLKAFRALVEHEKNYSDTVMESLKAITRQLLKNAELEDSKIEEIISGIINGEINSFDIHTQKMYKEDMFALKVIDPLSVAKEALKSAVSVVGTLLTTDTLVLNEDDGSGKISFN